MVNTYINISAKKSSRSDNVLYKKPLKFSLKSNIFNISWNVHMSRRSLDRKFLAAITKSHFGSYLYHWLWPGFIVISETYPSTPSISPTVLNQSFILFLANLVLNQANFPSLYALLHYPCYCSHCKNTPFGTPTRPLNCIDTSKLFWAHLIHILGAPDPYFWYIVIRLNLNFDLKITILWFQVSI
jgi:hypothetical protein